MELIIETITAYNRSVIGCRRHKRDIMIAFTHKDEKEPNAIHDLFLTQEQAVGLVECIKQKLEQNKVL